MKKILVFLTLLVAQLCNSQTIKLENYVIYERYCPSMETVNLEFSARDVWNNKLHGEFIFTVFVDGVVSSDVRIDGSLIRGLTLY